MKAAEDKLMKYRSFWTAVAVFPAILLAAFASAQPRFAPIPETALLSGSPLHVPLDGIAGEGEALTYTVEVSDPLVTAKVFSGNRSLRIDVATFGTMVFQLFDTRANRATNRIATLAAAGFYNGVIFHRIIDNFVIQGGDPTGTGGGGSELGNFDDQFHVNLQHNRTGLLSMAKVDDDTNDSQFFITEGPQRHLDFNHTIFGILVEGESVRQAVSNVAVDPANFDRPIVDVVMQSVTTFPDTQNAVLMLSAPEGSTGAADVTVTVANEAGASTSQTFRVNVTPDTINSPPFLADIPGAGNSRQHQHHLSAGGDRRRGRRVRVFGSDDTFIEWPSRAVDGIAELAALGRLQYRALDHRPGHGADRPAPSHGRDGSHRRRDRLSNRDRRCRGSSRHVVTTTRRRLARRLSLVVPVALT